MKKFFHNIKEAFKDIFHWFKQQFKNLKWKKEYIGYIGYLVVVLLLSFTGLSIYCAVVAMGVLAVIEIYLIIVAKQREKEEEERVDNIIALIAKKKIEENGGVLPEGEFSPIDAATEEAITKHLKAYKRTFWLHMFILGFAVTLVMCWVVPGFDG